MRSFFIGICLAATLPIGAEEFSSLLKKIETHPEVERVRQSYQRRSSQAGAESSLKDPDFRLSALNVPTSDFSFNKSAMSSKQISVSQRLPVSTRLGHLQDQSDHLVGAGKAQADFKLNSMRAELWGAAAQIESLSQQLNIVKESLAWIQQVDRATQRLYSTGKTSQINILEIKIRSSELESEQEELLFQLRESESKVGYLVGSHYPTRVEKVPWQRILTTQSPPKLNKMEQALAKENLAGRSRLAAVRLSRIPDITIGAAYSFREDVDGHGDFASGFVQFSIPIWGTTSAKASTAKASSDEIKARFDGYQLLKRQNLNVLSRRISSQERELTLLTKSIEFAESERRLATKRYSLGRLGVFQLLETELKLRQKRQKKENLIKSLRASRIELLLLKGDDLNV